MLVIWSKKRSFNYGKRKIQTANSWYLEAIFDAGYLIFDLIAGICSLRFQMAILCSSYTACWHWHFAAVTHSTLFRELSEQFTEATTKSKGNSASACRFINHNDSILHCFAVYLEAYISRIDSTCCSWSNDLDFRNHQNDSLRSSAKQLVFRRRQYETFGHQKRSFRSNGYRRNHTLRNYYLRMTRMVAAIIISFGCYIPVTLFSKTKPKVGLLMIPKPVHICGSS